MLRVRVRLPRLGLLVSAAVTFALALPAPAGAFIYFTHGGSDAWGPWGAIGRADLDGTAASGSFIAGGFAYPPAIGIDRYHIYFYVSGADMEIGSANLDGSGRKDRLFYVATPARDIAVGSQFFYWSTGVGIGRATLDGVLFSPAWIMATDAHGLAVDASHIYWTVGSNIARADLDGGNVNTAFITGASQPEGIAVNGTHIYWANRGSGADATIGRAKLDGTEVTQNLIASAGACDVALGPDTLYWSNAGGVGKANLDGSQAIDHFLPLTGAGCGIAVDGLARSQLSLTATPTSMPYGSDVSFKAKVTGGGKIPSGAVSFTVTDEDPVSVPLNNEGVATFEPDYYLNVGDKVTASYAGDIAHTASAADLRPDIRPAKTAIALESFANPQTVGQPVTVKATVKNLDTTIPPFGTVTAFVNGVRMGSAPVDDNGQAAAQAVIPEPGDYDVFVQYTDDTGSQRDFDDSSATLVQHVVPRPAPATSPSAEPAPSTPAPQVEVLGVRQGAAACTVPKLKGLKLAAAKKKLKRAHCRLGKVIKARAKPAQRGRVLSTKPSAGRKTTGRVTLKIGR